MTKFLARQTCLSRSMEERGHGRIGDVSEMWLAYSFGAFALHLPHMCHTNCAFSATKRRWAAGGCHTLQAAGCSNLLTIWLTFSLLVACKCCDLLATCHMPHATKQNLFVLAIWCSCSCSCRARASCITCISCYYRFVASTNKRNFLGHHSSSSNNNNLPSIDGRTESSAQPAAQSSAAHKALSSAAQPTSFGTCQKRSKCAAAAKSASTRMHTLSASTQPRRLGVA